jgi:AsnC-type helix-turn-helix domain
LRATGAFMGVDALLSDPVWWAFLDKARRGTIRCRAWSSEVFNVQEPIGSAAGMQHSPTLDETDLAIVHALQFSPQASWTLVGSVLEISPVTASRRWERLAEHHDVPLRTGGRLHADGTGLRRRQSLCRRRC